LGLTFPVYVITGKILERSATIFVWTLSGLLASMSLHLGSVAQLGIEISRMRKKWVAAGIRVTAS